MCTARRNKHIRTSSAHIEHESTGTRKHIHLHTSEQETAAQIRACEPTSHRHKRWSVCIAVQDCVSDAAPVEYDAGDGVEALAGRERGAVPNRTRADVGRLESGWSPMPDDDGAYAPGPGPVDSCLPPVGDTPPFGDRPMENAGDLSFRLSP
jgi:hypothetical protein